MTTNKDIGRHALIMYDDPRTVIDVVIDYIEQIVKAMCIDCNTLIFRIFNCIVKTRLLMIFGLEGI